MYSLQQQQIAPFLIAENDKVKLSAMSYTISHISQRCKIASLATLNTSYGIYISFNDNDCWFERLSRHLNHI